MNCEENGDGVEGRHSNRREDRRIIGCERDVDSLSGYGSKKSKEQVVVREEKQQRNDPGEPKQLLSFRMPEDRVDVEKGQQIGQVLFVHAPPREQEDRCHEQKRLDSRLRRRPWETPV